MEQPNTVKLSTNGAFEAVRANILEDSELTSYAAKLLSFPYVLFGMKEDRFFVHGAEEVNEFASYIQSGNVIDKTMLSPAVYIVKYVLSSKHAAKLTYPSTAEIASDILPMLRARHRIFMKEFGAHCKDAKVS